MSDPVDAAGARQGRIYYGWWMLAAVFITEMLSIGSTTYAYGLFVKPLAAEFHLSRAAAGNGMIVLQVGMAVMGLLIGPVLDRVSLRRVMLVGGWLIGGGLVLIGLAPGPLTMALCVFFLVCAGTAAVGPFAAQTAMARWFFVHRGRAMGLVTAATSMGGVLVAPLLAHLISLLGWRGALLVQGGLVAVVVTVVAALVIRSSPAELHLLDHRELAGSARGGARAGDAGAMRAWRRRELAANRNFWCLLLGIGLNLAIMNAMLGVTFVPFVTDGGISREAAAFLVACLSMSGVAGKVLNGALSDYLDRRYLVVAASLFTVLFLLILQAHPGYRALLGASCLAGLAIGSVMPVWGALIADCFGTAAYGTAIGFMGACMLPLHLLSVRLAGESFDRTGSYALAFQVFTGFALAAVVFILCVRVPRALVRHPAPSPA
ncbi:MAG: MFS transporter [Proteobacteria bacterium]|nr:MFS transporter [Pseudomonadota bacterium]